MTSEERDEVKQVVQEVLQEEGVAIDDNTIFPMKNSAGQSDALLMMQLDQQHQATDYSRINAENLPEGGGGITIDPTPTKDSPNAVSSGGVYDVTHGTLKTRYIPFDLRGESTIFLSDEDMTELFGPATMVGGQSMFDLTVGEYQHIYCVTNSKSEVFEILAAYHNANGVRKIVGINGNLTIELSFTIANGVYTNAAIKKRETSIPGISYEEEQDLTAAQRRTAQQNIGLEKDVAGGVAGLDENGKIVEQQIPTDVVDGANLGSTSVQFGDTQQLTPTQQVYAQNNMMGKAYSSVAADHSGLGKVYLDKNDGVLTQSMMQAANTVYVIQYDYTMSGNITVHAGCTLQFDGGSISGAFTLTGNSTVIKADLTKIFGKEVIIAGSWNVANIYSDWFEHITNENNTKQLQSIFALANYSVVNNVYLNDASYNLDGYDTVNNTPFVIAIPSNTKVYNKAAIQILSTTQNQSFPISVLRKENIKWQGGSIIGFASAQSNSDHRYGFHIRGGKNVEISKVTISRFCSDSIELQYGGNGIHNENIYIHDVVCDYSNRQGISIEDGIGVIIDNCKISNIGQIKPQSPASGIDIEPAYDEARFVNIAIKNVTITNTYGANLMFYLYNQQHAADITIDNLICDGSIFPTVIPESVNVSINNSQLGIYGGSSVFRHSHNIHFNNCTISDINVENNVVLHDYIFENCKVLGTVNIGSVDTSNIQFKNCQLYAVSSASNELYFYLCLFESTSGVMTIGGKYFSSCTFKSNDHVRLFCSDDTVLDSCSILVYQVASPSYGAVTLYARNTNTPQATFNNCSIECPNDVQMIMRDTTANTDLVVNFNGGYYPQFSEAVANAAHLDIRYTEGFGFFNKTLARNVSVSHITGSTILRQQVKRDTARHVFVPNTLVESKQYIVSSSWDTSSSGQFFAFAKEDNVESDMVIIINGTTKKTTVEFEALSASEYPYLYFDCNYPDLYFTISELVNRWIGEDGYTAVITSGITAERPTSELTLQDVGFRYFDKTLGKPIYLIASNSEKSWVDSNGSPV